MYLHFDQVINENVAVGSPSYDRNDEYLEQQCFLSNMTLYVFFTVLNLLFCST